LPQNGVEQLADLPRRDLKFSFLTFKRGREPGAGICSGSVASENDHRSGACALIYSAPQDDGDGVTAKGEYLVLRQSVWNKWPI
jgi:hypothetical protein